MWKNRITVGLLVAGVFLGSTYLTVSFHQHDRRTLKNVSQTRGQQEFEGTHAAEAMRWMNDQRAYPTGTIPTGWREKARTAINQHNLAKSSFSTASLSWAYTGPNNIGGRVRSIVLDPTNSNSLYCGSVSGGVWKSTNAGVSWSVTNDFAGSLVIGCMAIHPTNPNIIYAGTGEGYFNVDYLRGSGVLKSTDGGQNWTLLTNFSNTNPSFSYYYINKIVIRPTSPETVYAAMLGGVWRTTNGGTNWAQILSKPPTVSVRCTDLIMDPSNPDIMYAVFGFFSQDGIYKTINGGNTWSKVTGSGSGFPSTSDKYIRISLAIAPSNPAILFACIADSNGYTHSIQKTTNSGAAWFAAGTPTNPIAGNATHLGGQGWYNNVIAAHPTNPNVVFTGGINMYKSTDGGASWQMKTNWDPQTGYQYMHADQHAIVFDPSNPAIMYFGNDGGMYKSVDGGETFGAINNNLGITQFYSCAVHPTTEVYYGGTQDNGTLKISSSPAWNAVLTGDGGVTWVDQSTPSIVYTELPDLAITKSTNSGATWFKAMTGIPAKGGSLDAGTTDRVSFIAPITMDPSNSQILLAGTYRVWKTTNSGVQWFSISSDLAGNDPLFGASEGAVITAIAVAKSASQTVYVGTSGYKRFNSDGTIAFQIPAKVLVTTNGGTSWNDVTKSTLPDRQVTAIAIDPGSSDRVIVGYSGYDENSTVHGHVFLSENRGAAWSNISGDLPNLPVNAVVIDPANTNHIIIGTDMGVFETYDEGSSWGVRNDGLANVQVLDLDLRSDGYLFAATHGRGVYKSATPIESAQKLFIIIHQNAVLTRYIDLYVTAVESLSAAPTAHASINNGTPEQISLVQNSPSSARIYRGSYQFSSNGSYVITATATDSLGQNLSTTRGFQAQLLKQGVTQEMQSSDGGVSITVPGGVLTEDLYFTIIPEGKPSERTQLLSQSYTMGPEQNFNGALTVTFFFTDEMVRGRNERLLIVYRRTSEGWNPIPSWIDKQHHVVYARVPSLGTFALGYDEQHPSSEVPLTYRLYQNYPNPFNPQTTIRFDVTTLGIATVKVYDLLGREVASLLDEEREPGQYEIVWNGRDNTGNSVASGMYFYRLEVNVDGKVAYHAAQKMVIVK